jgi:hypothetical protein
VAARSSVKLKYSITSRIALLGDTNAILHVVLIERLQIAS